MAAARVMIAAENARRRPGEIAFAGDVQLAAAIATGHEESFQELYARYAWRIHAFALKRLRDATEAEDAVQDVFLEIHRCISSYQGRASLLSWMFGIAHRQICRRLHRRAPIGMSIDARSVTQQLSQDAPPDRRADAGRALETCAHVLEEDVSPAQREVFDLYYGGNQPTKAIAERLGRSPNAVKISLHRTRRAMKERLDLADQGNG